MADTVRTLTELLALFHDNLTKDIHPQQSRDLAQSVFGWISSTDPGSGNDRDDTAGLGAKFDTRSRWTNTTDHRLWECEDGATGAASWRQIWPQVTAVEPPILSSAREGGLTRGRDDDLRQLLLAARPGGLAVPVPAAAPVAEGIDELLLTRGPSGLASRPPRVIGPFVLSGVYDPFDPPGIEYADVVLVYGDLGGATLLGLAGGRGGRRLSIVSTGGDPIVVNNGSATDPTHDFEIQPTVTDITEFTPLDLVYRAAQGAPNGNWVGGVMGGAQVVPGSAAVSVVGGGLVYTVDIADPALNNWIYASDYGTVPLADRLLFFDFSAGVFTYLTAGTGLVITGTTINCTVTGTVTSFSAGNLSPLFTTSVATAGTTPALTFSLTTHNAHEVLIGPTSGGAAAPTFRVLVGSDLPVMVASGASHAPGAVPDPGATAGSTRYLNENAAFSVPGGTHLGQYLLGVQPVRSAKRTNESLNSLLLIGA